MKIKIFYSVNSGLYFAYQMPRVSVFSPERSFNIMNIDQTGPIFRTFQIGPFRVTAVSTMHEGRQYSRVPHNSLLINTDEECFFVAGDAYLSASLTDIFQNG